MCRHSVDALLLFFGGIRKYRTLQLYAAKDWVEDSVGNRANLYVFFARSRFGAKRCVYHAG